MRLIPRGLAALFKPVPLPPDPHGAAGGTDDMGERIARLVRTLGDRMIAAETGTVAAQRARVDGLFADMSEKFEERHGR